MRKKGEDSMKKRWLTMALALIMALGLSGFRVVAQPAGTPSQGEERRITWERREELRKKVELIWMQKLTEKLNLTEEERAKVFPLFRQYDERQRVLRQENRQLMRELQKMLDDNASEQELKKTIEALEENEHKLQELKEEGFHELAKIISIEKQAKYIVFQARFKHVMDGLIRRAWHKRHMSENL
jgi:DNA phosphorothioation-dependent restriction protein DptG